jgi:hypothetical protein
VAFDWRTDLLGIVVRHADDCPIRVTSSCRCQPLGYRGGAWDWQLDRWMLGPLVDTADEARAWQRAAHLKADSTLTTATSHISREAATPTEELCWWTFCLAAVGVGSILLAVAIAGWPG